VNKESIWTEGVLAKTYLEYPIGTLGFERTKPSGEKTYFLQRPVDSGWREVYGYSNTSFFRSPTKLELKKLQSIRPDFEKVRWSYEVNINSGHILGSDPEIFAVDGRGGVIPAYLFLGSKGPKNSLPTKTPTPFWDGYQGEFNIIPQACLSYVVDSIQKGLENTLTLAQKYNPKATLTGQCVLPISTKHLTSATSKQVQLGCAPSLNAYDNHGTVIPDGRELPIRFAGMHVHVQKNLYKITPDDQFAPRVRFIDSLAGVVSVAVLQGLENPLRRKFYGLAGEFRLPSHGLEYRVLSSCGLWHPAITHLLFGLVRTAYGLYEQNAHTVWEAGEDETQETINTLDVDQAVRIIKRNSSTFKAILNRLYPSITLSKSSQVLETLFYTGFKPFISLDITKNWHLDGGWRAHSETPGCNFGSFSKLVVK